MTAGHLPLFACYVGIDYSGAENPTSSLKGLRVFYLVDRDSPPREVLPPTGPRTWLNYRTLSCYLLISGNRT